jgi:uncharacterized RmlC-like cupin family protein
MVEKLRPVISHSAKKAADGSVSRLAMITGPVNATATRIWFGKATNKPGFRSLPRHHGRAETGGYRLSGNARLYLATTLRSMWTLRASDFMVVPPYLHRLEANMSITEELVSASGQIARRLLEDSEGAHHLFVRKGSEIERRDSRFTESRSITASRKRLAFAP